MSRGARPQSSTGASQHNLVLSTRRCRICGLAMRQDERSMMYVYRCPHGCTTIQIQKDYKTWR